MFAYASAGATVARRRTVRHIIGTATGKIMPKSDFSIRRALLEDAQFIAAIYNEGIDERVATFNTEHVTAEERRNRIERGGEKHPVFVAVSIPTGEIAGWASISEYSLRSCYTGIGEVSVYVKMEQRGGGLGTALMKILVAEAIPRGYWKLVGRVFVFNHASRNLCRKLGFREIGVLEKHSKLDGKWIDVVEVERLLPENII
jgi:phosphinothricin acetyltransferase